MDAQKFRQQQSPFQRQSPLLRQFYRGLWSCVEASRGCVIG